MPARPWRTVCTLHVSGWTLWYLKGSRRGTQNRDVRCGTVHADRRCVVWVSGTLDQDAETEAAAAPAGPPTAGPARAPAARHPGAAPAAPAAAEPPAHHRYRLATRSPAHRHHRGQPAGGPARKFPMRLLLQGRLLPLGLSSCHSLRTCVSGVRET